MTRIFGDFAYSDGPRDKCWWDASALDRQWPQCPDQISADVCIIGAGYSGLNAALSLTENGARVVVIDARYPGWGASGRNGGFCCLGGAKISQSLLEKRYGVEQALAYRRAEVAAVDHVAHLIDCFRWDVDRHSRGETQLAHSKRAMENIKASAGEIERLYGLPPTLHDTDELKSSGMGGKFFGGITIPIGFGLNPRKYIDALSDAVLNLGGEIFGSSEACSIEPSSKGYVVRTTAGARIQARDVILGLNGYADETLNDWMRARFMPAQSNVLVTRVLSEDELGAQGWHSDQMAYDSRNLLHYFRLMPDRRFLFGLRGGLLSSPSAEQQARDKARRDFERMFPAWAHVRSEHAWSGMVCLSFKGLPYCGPIPEQKGLWTTFAYHGNGVAMGSYLGYQLGQMIAGSDTRKALPVPVSAPPKRWPLGRLRRLLMPPVYAALALSDL